MRTIQEKYNGTLNETFSKKQFVIDAVRELPQFVTKFNSYKDTVSILKSKGVIREAKKETYAKPAPGYSIETLERGVDYELELAGLQSQETVSEEDYEKAKKKVEKNLEKNVNHYLDLLAGNKKKKEDSNGYVEVKKNNNVDKKNGMQKVKIKKTVNEGAVKSLTQTLLSHGNQTEVDSYLKSLSMDMKLNGKERYKSFKIEDYLEDFKEYIHNKGLSEKAKAKDLNGDKKIDSKDYMIARDRAIKGTKKEGIHDKDVLSRPISNPATGDYNMPPEMAKDHNDDRSYSAITTKYRKQINDPNISDEELEYILSGSGNPRMGGTPGAIKRVIQDRNQNSKSKDTMSVGSMKRLRGWDDQFDESAGGPDHKKLYVNEGRRRKMKGGKVVTENDYETGGYVESMGPRLDKALKALTMVWDEWKNGPATEPAMVPFAIKDLLNYIDNTIVVEENIEEDYKPSHRAYNVIDGKGNIVYKELPRHTAIEKASEREDYKFTATDNLAEENIDEQDVVSNEQLKEAMKGIINKILSEDILTEAATGNLSKIATTYEDFEGMQTAVNSLENIVTDVESYYGKTKEKIQKVYDSFKDIKNVEGLAVGAMIGPAIEAAFRKDLMPVTEKGFTKGLEMPKVKMLETDAIAEEELDEKETVFTPVTETKKSKYTKRK